MQTVKLPLISGILASAAILSLYFLVLTFVSGWPYTLVQFKASWYYIVSLAIGFGIQFGLYTYLKAIIKQQALGGRVLVTTGAASTGAMISCCAHYLTNILPVLGATGLMTFIGQYQVQFFWVGLFFNFLGIAYMINRISKVRQQI